MFFPDVVAYVRDALWNGSEVPFGEQISEGLSKDHGLLPLGEDQWWESTGLWLRSVDEVVAKQLAESNVRVDDVFHHDAGGYLVSRMQVDLGADRAGTGPGCVLLAAIRHADAVPELGPTMTDLSFQSEAFLLDAEGPGYLTGRRAVALAMTVHSMYSTKVRVDNVRIRLCQWGLR